MTTLRRKNITTVCCNSCDDTLYNREIRPICEVLNKIAHRPFNMARIPHTIFNIPATYDKLREAFTCEIDGVTGLVT